MSVGGRQSRFFYHVTANEEKCKIQRNKLVLCSSRNKVNISKKIGKKITKLLSLSAFEPNIHCVLMTYK